MGYVITRVAKKGFRYVAMSYRDGKRISLGTFPSEEEALAIIAGFEAERTDELSPSSTFNEVIDHWLPTVRELTTRKGYRGDLRVHVRPLLGQKPLKDITRKDIKRVMEVAAQHGLNPTSVRKVRACMSACLSWAVEEDLIPFNPAQSVKAPPNNIVKPQNAILPNEMILILEELKKNYAKGAYLLAYFLIETGCRYSEATEVRPKDLDWRTNTLFVSRAVADIGAEDNPTKGGRFYVKSPKSRKGRRVSLSQQFMETLKEYVEEEGIADDELIFHVLRVQPAYSERNMIEELDLPALIASGEAGLTEPNDRGFVYQHGTETAYSMAKCRCEYCKAAVRQAARKRRKRKRPRSVTSKNLTGHLPRDAWRKIWIQATTDALGTKWIPRTHDIRHANATWLIKGGVDLHTVQERLGHGSIVTTQGYFHNLQAMEGRASEVLSDFLTAK